MPFWGWSKTPATNATADPTINMAEGMPPAQLNDGCRAIMAGAAQYRDDTSGLLVTSGISTAYTVTTNQGLPATPNDGQLIVVSFHITNGANATLAADGGTAFPIQAFPGAPPGAALITAGAPVALRFRAASSAWIMFGSGVSVLTFGGANGSITNAALANAPAWTIKGNASGSSAAPTDFTILGLVQKTAPVSNDLVLIWDFAAGQMKNVQANTLGQTFNQPTVQRFTSGSGTYTATTGTVRVKVRMCGGGGGGGAASTNGGGTGGTTQFGGWTAIGGTGGGAASGGASSGGTGGANGAGTLVQRLTGGTSSGGLQVINTGNFFGGIGGTNMFGGAGMPTQNGAGTAGIPNTGAGGGGGGAFNSSSGAGGGAGEVVEFWATVAQANGSAWAVGAGGNGGAAGGSAGGAGGAGQIIVEEFYT